MSQSESPCRGPMVELPVCSLKLAVSESAFDGIGGKGEGLDLRFEIETKTNNLYMGKPVYMQLFDFGALPNAEKKEVPHGIPNVEWISVNEPYSTVRYPGGYNYPLLCAATKSLASSWHYYVSSEVVTIITGKDRSSSSAIVCLMYTKTTDTPLP